MRVIAVPGQWEIHVMPYDNRHSELVGNYTGASGIFENRINLFESLEECLDYLYKEDFDDSVIIDSSLKEGVEDYFRELGFEDVDGNIEIADFSEQY